MLGSGFQLDQMNELVVYLSLLSSTSLAQKNRMQYFLIDNCIETSIFMKGDNSGVTITKKVAYFME